MGRIVALVQDLFFAARVEALLAGLGVPIETVEPNPATLADLQGSPPQLLVLDLGVPAALRDAVLAWAPARLPVIAFGSHVESAITRAAREAGCAAVMPNGRLAQDLPGAVRLRLPHAAGSGESP